jgi:hypothetical protein
MNEPLESDWQDLSKLWQADAAAVQIEEIDAYLADERRQLRLAALGELTALGIGIAAASWVAFFTPYRAVGIALALFAGASAFVARQLRRTPSPTGSAVLARSLKDSIAREDWVMAQLRFGRALSLVALFALVFATAAQLRFVRPLELGGVWAATAGTVFVLAALVWNLVLTRRARVRRERLEYLSEWLEK